jgi:hypothetical protein
MRFLATTLAFFLAVAPTHALLAVDAVDISSRDVASDPTLFTEWSNNNPLFNFARHPEPKPCDFDESRLADLAPANDLETTNSTLTERATVPLSSFAVVVFTAKSCSSSSGYQYLTQATRGWLYCTREYQ